MQQPIFKITQFTKDGIKIPDYFVFETIYRKVLNNNGKCLGYFSYVDGSKSMFDEESYNSPVQKPYILSFFGKTEAEFEAAIEADELISFNFETFTAAE